MKILFCVRYDFYTKPGGDTVQTNAYIEELNKLNCITHVTTKFEDFELNYDIFHLINLDRPLETHIQIKYILENRTNAKIVISTIHHDMNQVISINKLLQNDITKLLYKLVPNINFIELLKNVIRVNRAPISFLNKAKYIFIQRKKFVNQQRFILENVNKILLLSDFELGLISRDLNIKIPKNKCKVIPNGINTKLFDNIDFTHKNGILCVARIEPRKNQMKLLDIAGELPFNITFIGKVNYNNCDYYNKFISKVEDLENGGFDS